MKNFDGFGLSPALADALARMNYTTPTPIQAQSIPLALKGRDVMGSAQTGTGKTAAYAIPAVQHLMNNDTSTALILTPTRELGSQVMDIMTQMLGSKSKIKTAFIIGGEPMRKQFQQLERRPRLIVGTPGRINDHLERGSIDLNKADFLVLDETDRMLDMGFSVQLDRIFKYMPTERQTLMFSATLPPEIMRMSKSYLNNPERIAVGSTIEAPKAISQQVIKIDDHGKYDELISQLHDRNGSIIMFVKTKFGTERMAKRLKSDGHDAVAIHGDLKQSRRERVIRDYRDQKFRILVATDVVARGLDIPHIKHVVNYDLPQVPEDFIHRIGRTARAGEMGEALSFVTPQEGRKWHAIEMLMDPDKVANDHKSGRSFNGDKKRRGSNDRNRSNDGGFKAKSFKGKKDYSSNERADSGSKFRKPNKRADMYGDKPNEERSEKPFNAKPEGAGKAAKKAAYKSGGKPFGKKPFNTSDRSPSERARDDRNEGHDGSKQFVKPFSKKTMDGKSAYGEKKTYGEKKSYSDKPAFGEKKTYGDKPSGKKPFRKDGEKKTYGEKKSYGDKPSFGEKKSYGDKPSGKKPFRKDGEKKSYGEKKTYGDKPSGKKTFGKPAGKAFNRDGAKRNDGSKPFSKKRAA